MRGTIPASPTNGLLERRMMSDMDKPAAAPPAAKDSNPLPAEPTPSKVPPSAKQGRSAPRPERHGERDRSRRERRDTQYTPVPSLEHEIRPGPNLRDLDAEIERELQEALGGGDTEGMLAEATRGGKPQPAQSGQPPGRKKGKIISIHGADIFVQVPGRRSEGVLSM